MAIRTTAVRTTVDIPEPLHAKLREKAHQTGTSMRALIVQALEQTYSGKKKGVYVTRPMIPAGGKRGPRYPVDETPYDLVLY
jgi:hypothetical protein